MPKTFSFEEALAPAAKASEVDTIRAGVAGPLGATNEQIDREAAATRENLQTVTDPEDRQNLQEHLDDLARHRALPQPGEARETFSFEEATRPPAKQPLPADVTPSSAGAGRGSVNPPLASQPQPQPEAPPPQPDFSNASGAGDAAAITAQPTTDKVGSVLERVPPESVGASYMDPQPMGQLDPNAPVHIPGAQVSPDLATAMTQARANRLRAEAPAPTVGNVASGIRDSVALSALRTVQGLRMEYADATGDKQTADEAKRFIDLSNKWEQQGTPAFDSKAAELAYGGTTGLAKSAPGIALGVLNPAIGAAFFGGQTQAEAYGKYRARGGTPLEASAGGVLEGAITAGTGYLPLSFMADKLGKAGMGQFIAGLVARDVPAMTAQGIATDLVDTAIANPKKTWGDFLAEQPEHIAQSLASAAVFSIAGAAGHGAVRAGSAIADRTGSPSRQFGRALDQDVQGAQFAPAEGVAAGEAGFTPNPNLAAAQPDAAAPAAPAAAPPPGPNDTSMAAAQNDIASQLAAIRPLQDRAKALRDAGEQAVADELDRRAATQSADIELQAHPDAGPDFEAAYRSLRANGAKPAEASARAGMLGAFAQHAQQAGITPRAIEAATEQAGKLPLARVPQFLDTYVSALNSAGMGKPIEPQQIENASRDAGEQAMGRAIDALYPQARVEEPAGEASIQKRPAAEQAASPQEAGTASRPGLERFPPESGSLGIPREQLPQIRSEDHGALVNFLNAREIPHEIHMLPPEDLKPTQAEFSPQKVRDMAGVESDRSVIASSDGYILDGHHQWMAAKEGGQPVKTIVLDAPIRTLIEHAKEFPSARKETDQTQAAQAIAPDQGAARGGEAAGADARATGAGADGGEGAASVELLGRDYGSLDGGAKPFSSSKEAQDARKLTPHLRVVRVEGGFALAPKSAAQLAAEERSAQRLSLPKTSEKGTPIPAHAFIAAEGGLRRGEMADTGFDRNVRVGNRTLFAAQGKGMTIEQATERLIEAGYLHPGALHNDAYELIRKSVKVPQYNAEGLHRIAQAEHAARFEDYLRAEREHEDSLVPLDERDAEGIVDKLTPEQEDEMRALVAAADAAGVDTEAILEDAARKTENGTAHDYFQEARGTLEAAARPVGEGTARGEGARAGRNAAEPGSAERSGSVPGEQGAPRSDRTGEKDGLSWQVRDTGTLAVHGDPAKIKEVLKGIPERSFMVMDGGFMIGRTQADKALKILEGQPEESKAKPLSVGTTPGDVEPVSVKNGIVHIGKHEAIDFDSGEPVKVKDGASDAEIRKALKDAGALSKRQKFFYGGQNREMSEGLTVSFDGKTYPVASIEDAQAKWNQFRAAASREGGGVRDVGNGVVVKNASGKELGRISYNGRFHPAQPSADLLGETPNASQQAAANIRGEKAEQEQRQQQQAPTPGEFRLTGSNRPADEAATRGQRDLLSGDDFDASMHSRAFYSDLERNLGSIDARAMPADGWANRIKGLVNAGKVKADEVEWSGLSDWLKLQDGKVTKDQVMQFLNDNGVQIHEVVKDDQQHPDETGEDQRRRELEDMSDEQFADEVYDELGIEWEHGTDRDDYIDDIIREQEQAFDAHDGAGEQSKTKYGKYTLPGGGNYREVLLTLPVKRSTDGSAPPRYRSSHWDEDNVLAHIRLNDRTDAEGKKVLFVEELQSDWAQAARKHGFAEESPNMEGWSAKLWDNGAVYEVSDANGRFVTNVTRSDMPMTGGFTPENAIGVAQQRLVHDPMATARQGKVPAAPFVGKTDAWLSLALKRIVKMAADEGYDRVAFVNGEQSADRYDLSKQISRVRFEDNHALGVGRADLEGPHTSGNLFAYDLDGKQVIDKRVNDAAKELPDLIGKEAAAKLLEQPGRSERTGGGNESRVKELKGLDLKVGGEGMKSFYDKIVPAVAKDVLKKLGGGSLHDIDLSQPRFVVTRDRNGRTWGYEDEAGAGESGFATKEEATAAATRDNAANNGDAGKQIGFDITPAMREKAAEGMPMFRRGGFGAGNADVARVQAITDRIAAKWTNGPKIEVVPTHHDLPGEHPRNTSGLYMNGKAYLVADRLGSKAAVENAVGRVVAHEVIAHHGLRELLGREDWYKLMGNINRAIEQGNVPLSKIRDEVRRLYVDRNGRYMLTDAREADEIAARAVEQAVDENGNFRPGFGFFKAVFAKIAQFLRDHGINITFTNSELQGMLVLAQRHLEAGERTAGRGQMAIAAADRGVESRDIREEGLPRDIPHLASTHILDKLKEHPDYKAAKAGDIGAAVNVVRDVVTPENLQVAREKFGKDSIFVAPMAEEASGKNALPQALAALYASETGGSVDRDIVQTNKAFHTGANAMQRMIARPLFDGPVKPGGKYVIVDDVTTMGGTLAELADHIRAAGGDVVGTAVIANVGRESTMDARPQDVRKIKDRYGDQVRQLFHAEPAALTAAEARYVLGHRNADELANRAASASEERAARLRSKGLQQEGVGDDFSAPGGAQSRTAEATPEEGDKSSSLPGHSLIVRAADLTHGLLREGKMFATPMNAGSPKARAVAQEFANSMRVARDQWQRMDRVLTKEFSDEDRKRMWEAADAENVERMRASEDPEYKRPANVGLDSLSPKERAAVERLHEYGEELLQRARDVGMFKGEGLPYWAPRMAVMIGEDGELGRIPSDFQHATSEKSGRNVTTTSSNLKQRKYLTAAETEAAASELAKSKGGAGAQLVRDIRTMPLAMARLERAIAGRELINQIKEIGLATGEATTSSKEGPGFFTLDHPAFKEYRFRPDIKMTEARDKHLWEGLQKFAEQIGVTHERIEKLRGRTWGYATNDGHVVTRFGGPETVLTHELGHQLDFKYGLADMLTRKGATAKELRALADLRYEGIETSDYFKKYVRRGTEKIANMVHAYVHMPERFKEVAPQTYKAFEQFLDAHPELAGLRKIKPSLVLNSDAIKKRPPGEDFDVLPLYISKDFEGPLKAVLSNQDGEWYKAYMLLKSKAMSSIMFSPLIHNMVIWGRALAYSPSKVGSTYLYWKGSSLEHDPQFVRGAIKDGVVPIGYNRTTAMDAVDLAGKVEKMGAWGDPNESWVNLSLQKAGNWIKAGLGDKTKAGMDAAGDFWHHTLLWKQIQNLQWGIYADAKQHYMAKGMREPAAGALAAHFANRYAGVVAQENQGELARKAMNILLFSRSFNITNVGVWHDMLFGLPAGLKAQLYEKAPKDEADRAVWAARRKAASALVLDAAFAIMATSLVQDLVDKLRGTDDEEAKKGYIDRLRDMAEGIHDRPLDLDSYNPYRLSSTWRNEPGKKDRVDFGADVGGRHQYMRLPTGKAIEDIMNWALHPGETFSAKMAPMPKAAWQVLQNDKGFGVPVRDPNGSFYKAVWESTAHVLKAQMPSDAIKQAWDVTHGFGEDIDKKKLAGNVTGFTFSQGHPGGPEAEVAAKANERFEASKKYTMQLVKDDLKHGDEDMAIQRMQDIGMSNSEIRMALRRAETPSSGLSAKARKNFEQRANDAERREMELQQNR
jgi:hypothetical protein